jgi:ABC-type nitrate/sulfonate/bicarbonate transport system permease component
MRFADSPGVFAGIIVIAATGMLVIKSLELTRRYPLRWHQEQH